MQPEHHLALRGGLIGALVFRLWFKAFATTVLRKKRPHLMRLLAAGLCCCPLGASAALDALSQTRLSADLRCLLGVYTLPSQRWVTITGNNGQTRGLRYTLSNGLFADLTELPDGSWASGSLVIRFEPCSAGSLQLAQGSVLEHGTRLPLVETHRSFTSDGIRLHGKLVAPPDGAARALAVWIEGSNNNPSTDDAVWPYELARRGVAVFVYDKRGTGASGGAPLSDFHARARDSAAALKQARELAPYIRRVGVIGGSQGGWVAPLVATLAPLDFVIAAFAMAQGPIAQDQALVAQQLQAAGFGPTVQAQARQLMAITERIVRSNLREGPDELDAFKSRWSGAPWLDAIEPRSYTGLFLKFSSQEIKTHGPTLAQGLSFDHEPRPFIESIRPRQLWLLGGKDRQAPNAGTQAVLRQIQLKRRDLAVVVFPNAEHGLTEPTQTAEGMGVSFAPRLFDTTADWIKYKALPASGRFINLPASP